MKKCERLVNLVWAKSPWEKLSPAGDFVQGTYWDMTKQAYIKLPKEDQFKFLQTMFRQKEKEA